MISEQVDVLIIGGGAVGALLALGLEQYGFNTQLVDGKDESISIQPHTDARSIALSQASIEVLTALNIWSVLEMQATPIESIHVSQQGAFGAACIRKDKLNPLGYVVEMSYLLQVLYQKLSKKTLFFSTQLIDLDRSKNVAVLKRHDRLYHVQAKLLVAADGARSTVGKLCNKSVIEKQYNQSAIVANIELSRAHRNMAFERLTTDGVMAVLPLSKQWVSLVWMMPSTASSFVMSLTDTDFLQHVRQCMGYRLGRFKKVSKRTMFPLRQVIMPNPTVDDWIVFLGNAEHTLHPIAAQGFNLSVRDVAGLIETLVKFGFSQNTLSVYRELRASDKQSVLSLIDWLLILVGHSLPLNAMAKGMGLFLFNQLPGLKKIFSLYAQGFGDVSSDLICGIPIERINHDDT